MRTYKQLTHEQRYQIYILKQAGHSQKDIASMIGVHNSTISRELRRNRGQRGYRPKQAHRMAMLRHKHKAKPRILQSAWRLIEHLIRNDWSPEQISGWFKQRGPVQVSHEWIYRFILADKQAGGDLHHHLRCKKKRKKRYGCYDRRGQLPSRISIDQRPAVVDSRTRLGDWEVDTIIGKGHSQALVSLTERKSKLSLLRKVERKTAEAVRKAIIALLLPLKIKVRTITADNGKEFAGHKQISESLKTRFFFAHPYSSWERGTNENTNGLIRQYFPKDRNFKTISNDEIRMVMNRLNNRPRKSLGFKTPNQVFFNTNQVALTT